MYVLHGRYEITSRDAVLSCVWMGLLSNLIVFLPIDAIVRAKAKASDATEKRRGSKGGKSFHR